INGFLVAKPALNGVFHRVCIKHFRPLCCFKISVRRYHAMVSSTRISGVEAACSVCGEPAFVECFLYDVYLEIPDVVMKRDFTCPYLCEDHFRENEEKAFSEVSGKELNVTLSEIAERYREGERRMDRAIAH